MGEVGLRGIVEAIGGTEALAVDVDFIAIEKGAQGNAERFRLCVGRKLDLLADPDFCAKWHWLGEGKSDNRPSAVTEVGLRELGLVAREHAPFTAEVQAERVLRGEGAGEQEQDKARQMDILIEAK